MTFRRCLVGTVVCALASQAAWSASALSDPETRKLSRDIFQELIEINTTDSVGSTTPAAEGMAQRLWDAGFSKADVVLLSPDARKGNMVARYRGSAKSKLRPILLIGHLDVVEAKREDWTTDPFKLVEKDGYFYGRGTEDMKAADASLIADFIRLKREGFVPNRDIILALTASEEGGQWNGVDWLLKNHRELIDAEFVLNPDGGKMTTDKGKPLVVEIEAAEKLYADFQVMATNPGGHSSRPTPDNAIYHLTNALDRLQKSPFPFELNPVTREYFTRMIAVESPQHAADIRGMLATPPDESAIAGLSQDIRYNATIHTTCVPTQLAGGHAPNALPQRASANVNCRILPGHSQEEVRLALVKAFDDPTLSVKYQSDAFELFDHGSDHKAMTPPPLNKEVMASLTKVSTVLWPGIQVIPDMENGASDSIYTAMAGIPSYGVSGVAVDADDHRMHGRDERIRVEAFYDAVQFYYLYLKDLTRAH